MASSKAFQNSERRLRRSNVHITVLTLFPEAMKAYFLKGIFAKALDKGLFQIDFIQLREFAKDRRASVDDTPFGGGNGMLLRSDVLSQALSSIEGLENSRIIMPCPVGESFGPSMVWDLLSVKRLILICGYYEGVDERIFDLFTIEKIRIGDVILSSGELPALIIAEAVLRWVPGVVGNQESVRQDSIVSGLLEYPQYTFPREFSGQMVPDVLLSGHHKRVEAWKKKKSLETTFYKRPDLLKMYQAEPYEKELLVEILKED